MDSYIAENNGMRMAILPEQMAAMAAAGFAIYRLEEVPVDDPEAELAAYREKYEQPIQVSMGVPDEANA